MAKRPPRPRDPMQLAKLIGDIATGQAENVKPTVPSAARRKGGLKGGRSRAKKLSRQKRQAIAKLAANARWSRSQKANKNASRGMNKRA